MKISYKPRLSGLCSIYGAKHRGQSNIEVNTEAGNTSKGLYLQFQSDAAPIENKISGDGVIRVAGEVSVKSSDISDYHGEWDVLPAFSTFLAVNFI